MAYQEPEVIRWTRDGRTPDVPDLKKESYQSTLGLAKIWDRQGQLFIRDAPLDEEEMDLSMRFFNCYKNSTAFSALVKGRSPSLGLRRVLRRAGATCIAGCLYIGYRFGPTRLLPADHPTRDNDMPSPSESFLPCWTESQKYDLLEKLSVPRVAANWVRVFLRLLGTSPPWLGSGDSWRYAHVVYKHYPFTLATRKGAGASQDDIEFNACLAGEGHWAKDSSFHPLDFGSGSFGKPQFPGGLPGIWILPSALFGFCLCLASALSHAVTNGFALSRSWTWIFFHGISPCLWTFIQLPCSGSAGLPSKSIPHRFSCCRAHKPPWVLLTFVLCVHIGVAAPSHGPGLKPRDPRNLGQTQKQRDQLLEGFDAWLREQRA